MRAATSRKGSINFMSETHSVNDIRTAIRELSARADLARKEGRPDDAAELEQRVEGYRKELGERP
jgi:propanediol dehydratase small subunit